MSSTDQSLDSLRPGDHITIRSFHADGTCYRWWTAEIELVTDSMIVIWMPSGTLIEALNGGWVQHYQIRAYYWLDRFYNLLEVYDQHGTYKEVYIHIASPIAVSKNRLDYTDHELDVICSAGGKAEVIDEDEYQEAIQRYSYSNELQRLCRAATREACQVAETWSPLGVRSTSR